MEKVVVLLSSYNGEQYISEQIDSILAQTGVEVEILIRDDGSTDSTMRILKSYERQHSNICVIAGENVGWRRSFSELIVSAPESAYYAFADQDDYWMAEKLSVAVGKIHKYEDLPCLYRGRSYIADGELRNSGKMFQNIPVPDTTRSLFQNYCQGCTLVFNQKLRKQYLHFPIATVSHDIWIPMLARHCGKIVDDDSAYMLYRVHLSNATAGESWFKTWKRRMKVICRKSASKLDYNYGEALYCNFRDCLHSDSLEICRQMANYQTDLHVKFALLFNPKVRGNSLFRTMMVKYFILTNGYRCY